MLFDHPETLEPEAILHWHSLCTNSLDQELRRVHLALLNGTTLASYLEGVLPIGSSLHDTDTYFEACKDELDLAANLALIAAAEARIRLDLERRCQDKDNLAQRLKLLKTNADKDYQIALYDNGIMDAWKDCVASLTALSDKDRDRHLSGIGGLKSVLPVRHWVAHGRYWELQGGIKRYPPVSVAIAITRLYAALQNISRSAGVRQFA